MMTHSKATRNSAKESKRDATLHTDRSLLTGSNLGREHSNLRALGITRDGHPLEGFTRIEMESHFEQDLSRIRIHDDPSAHKSAVRFNADAYTIGSQIVFNRDKFQPASQSGKRLLTHELAHALQTTNSRHNGPIRSDSGFERAVENKAQTGTASQYILSQPYNSLGLTRRATSKDPTQLNESELAREYALVSARLAKGDNYPDRENDEKYLRGLEEELSRRQSASKAATPPKPIPMTPTQKQRIKQNQAANWANLPSGLKDTLQKQLGVKAPEQPPVFWSGGVPSPKVKAAAEKGATQMRKDKPIDVGPRVVPGKLELEEKLANPPRTQFESIAQRRRLKPVRDPKTKEIIGYLMWRVGVLHLMDLEGRSVRILGEKPLETPLLDPIDFIPFELLASLSVKAATITGRAALKMVGKIGAEETVIGAGKVLGKEAAALGERELASMVEKKALTSGPPKGPEVFAELAEELGTTPAKAGGRSSAAAAAAEAEAAGFIKGAEAGTVDLAVQSHSTAPTVRKILGLSGQAVESAHVAPTAAMKGTAGYSRGRALTTLLPKEAHAALDKHWKDWAIALRRAGAREISAGELYKTMSQAIKNTPGLSVKTKGALEWKLFNEMFGDMGLQWGSKVRLPYSNIRPKL